MLSCYKLCSLICKPTKKLVFKGKFFTKKVWSDFKVSIAGADAQQHNLLYNLLYQQPSNSFYNHTHISKSLLPKGLRTSPESDSGAPSLTPVAGSVPFSSDHIAEFPEGSLSPEKEPSSLIWGDTSLSSPSKSDHDMEESPCHHQATTKKTPQEKGTVDFCCCFDFVLSIFTNSLICTI